MRSVFQTQCIKCTFEYVLFNRPSTDSSSKESPRCHRSSYNSYRQHLKFKYLAEHHTICLHSFSNTRRLVFSAHLLNRFLNQVPSVNTVTYGYRSFSYYAPKNWNSLPNHIEYYESVSTFMQQLKTFLIRNNYFTQFIYIKFTIVSTLRILLKV